MALFVKITSPKVWCEGDYTDNATHDINMTIYSDQEMTSTVDLTTFTTITMRLIDPNHNGKLVWDSTEGVSGNASGVITWTPTSGSTFHTKGTLKVRPRFENSTEKLTAVGVNASDEIYVKPD